MTSLQSVQAQIPEGVYRLSGGHEMVAAFQFKKDSFEFYFIYGAVDRNSKGHYKVRDGIIFLQSDKVPGNDFTVVRQEHRGEGTTVQLSDANIYLVKNVVGFFKKGPETDQQFSDEKGYLHSALTNCDTVYVMHSLFPDVPTLVPKTAPLNNYFELKLNPSLAEVSFKDFFLNIEADGLSGSLPWLFEREKALFVKEPE